MILARLSHALAAETTLANRSARVAKSLPDHRNVYIFHYLNIPNTYHFGKPIAFRALAPHCTANHRWALWHHRFVPVQALARNLRSGMRLEGTARH